MVEASIINGNFNAWLVKVIKVHTIAIRRLYCVKDIDRGNYYNGKEARIGS